ncbi:hemerythrin domain-containing protein [Celerinatantimonas yamalensis]|uniref:Hemerythrin domain-containing protein n=1 Tax=Celerinatantimonas yamalensis TaxID=559956 RepID=A0ABW9G666_9GAMM
MLDSIKKDHINISSLLRVLEKKLHLIRSGQAVKYKLIADIITYMRDYADKYHHPKEDVIYEYYRKYRSDSEQLSNRLAQEHEQLCQLTVELADVLDLILLDAVIPLDQFSQKLEKYIQLQWDHLNYEENEVFPILKQSLLADDWRNIEQNWDYSGVVDPLFGGLVDKQFQELSERIHISES